MSQLHEDHSGLLGDGVDGVFEDLPLAACHYSQRAITGCQPRADRVEFMGR